MTIRSKLYLEKGLATTQIAKQTFSSRTAVLAALKQFNIPTREPAKPHGNPAKLRFGRKKWLGKIVDHKKEQSIIKTIHKLSAEGLSLRKKAEVMSEMKSSTDERGRK